MGSGSGVGFLGGDDEIGGMAAWRFRLRSSSSSSNSLIKTSKLAIDKLGGEVTLIRIAGRVAPGRIGGVVRG